MAGQKHFKSSSKKASFQSSNAISSTESNAKSRLNIEIIMKSSVLQFKNNVDTNDKSESHKIETLKIIT